MGRRRLAHWELLIGTSALALAGWLRNPGLGWALLAAVAAGAAAVLAAAAVRRVPVAAVTLAAAAVGAALATSLRVRAVENDWPTVREALIRHASAPLSHALREASQAARELADGALELDLADPDAAFRSLERTMSGGGPERGVVVMRPEGRPIVWAGSHRVPPAPAARELTARITPFYVLLEAHRQTPDRHVVGHVVLAADSAVPDPGGTVAARFTAATGAGLQFFARGTAPDDPDVFDYCLGSCEPGTTDALANTLFSVRPTVPSQGAQKLHVQSVGSRWVAALSLLLLAVLVAGASHWVRWGAAFGVVALLVYTTAGEHVGLGALFSAAFYYLDGLGAFSASAGGLLLAGALLAVGLLRLVGRFHAPRRAGVVLGLALAVAAPWIMRWLAGGITPPAMGVGIGHWLSWQVPLTVVGAALGIAAAVLSRGTRGSAPPWVSWFAGLWAAGAAVVGLALWHPVTQWPLWYGLLWLPATVAAVQAGSRLRLVLTVGTVAGTAAAVLTWGAVVQGRLTLAEQDARRLGGGDPVAIGFLERFGESLLSEEAPASAAELYARWRRSPLAWEDYPGQLATWAPDGRRVAFLSLAELELPPSLPEMLLAAARAVGRPVVRAVGVGPGVHYMAGIPFPDGTVVTAAVGPRSRLVPPVLVGRFLRGERRLQQPYQMSLGDLVRPGEDDALAWRRDGWVLSGVQVLAVSEGARPLHVTVRLRDLSSSVIRGVLLVLLGVCVLGVLAIVAEGLAGTLRVPAALSEIAGIRSYRVRLGLALGAFWLIPTLGYATWSIGRIQLDAARSRDLLIQQTLGEATGAAQQFVDLPLEHISLRLEDMTSRLGADFLWYEDGGLAATSAPVLSEFGLMSQFLPPAVLRELRTADDRETTDDAVIGGQPTRVGYRAVGGEPPATSMVLAAPMLVDVTDAQREREDLLFGLLLATLLGLAGAGALATRAARSLAQPVQALRAAAVAVGRGKPLPPFGPHIPAEFVSVMDAFERMARDVEASQSALEAARRRTATVLSNVATGVVALDTSLRVTIANAKAGELLGAELEPGTRVAEVTDEEWQPVWDWVRVAPGGDAELEAQEFQVGARRIRVQIAPLHTDPQGCVVALDDTTEAARALRVLAWGELARQIAHEIKNPLTPIRLGIQHLQRARRHGRADFDATLERTANQILAEIERLDAIARAFARFGAPPEEAAPLVRADVAAIARETAALYALGGGARVVVRAESAVFALVRPDEVKEVLVNLVENARDAGAAEITIAVPDGRVGKTLLEVKDDGSGITKEHLAQVFEPRFSTTSSGTGLGLAICRRLVESWGGTIEVDSMVDRGTTVTIAIPTEAAGEESA